METAQVWTMIGLSAALVGLLAMSMLSHANGLRHQSERTSDLKVAVGALENRVGNVERKQEEHDSRFDAIDRRLDAHDGRFDALEEQGRAIAQAIYDLGAQLREHLRRHAS